VPYPGKTKVLEELRRMDDVAPPYGGAVNPSYRQTARRDVRAARHGGGLEGANRM